MVTAFQHLIINEAKRQSIPVHVVDGEIEFDLSNISTGHFAHILTTAELSPHFRATLETWWFRKMRQKCV